MPPTAPPEPIAPEPITPEPIRFAFDPLCPWCYQTSRWVRRLAELDVVAVEWGLFSLELANAENPELATAKQHGRSAPALRTAVVVRDTEGTAAVGDFYRELGRRVHELGEAVDDPAVIEGALRVAGLDTAAREKALADDATWDAVVAEHTGLVERTRSFGVPTIVLDGGDGPAIFGPVISEPPASDDEAVELWRHVVWLARYDNFSELKRDRTITPDLESVRAFQRRQAQQA